MAGCWLAAVLWHYSGWPKTGYNLYWCGPLWIMDAGCWLVVVCHGAGLGGLPGCHDSADGRGRKHVTAWTEIMENDNGALRRKCTTWVADALVLSRQQGISISHCVIMSPWLLLMSRCQVGIKASAATIMKCLMRSLWLMLMSWCQIGI